MRGPHCARTWQPWRPRGSPATGKRKRPLPNRNARNVRQCPRDSTSIQFMAAWSHNQPSVCLACHGGVAAGGGTFRCAAPTAIFIISEQRACKHRVDTCMRAGSSPGPGPGQGGPAPLPAPSRAYAAGVVASAGAIFSLVVFRASPLATWGKMAPSRFRSLFVALPHTHMNRAELSNQQQGIHNSHLAAGTHARRLPALAFFPSTCRRACRCSGSLAPGLRSRSAQPA